MPQKGAIGSAAWVSTTTACARSNASPSTCQRAMRINSHNPCVLVASAILAQAEVDALDEGARCAGRCGRGRGSPGRRCVKASVNRVASSTSSRMSLIRASGSRR